MLRAVDRNNGRAVLKNVRTAQIPQAGLSTAIIPDAVHTTVVGVDVIAIRVDSSYKPMRIDSDNPFPTGRRSFPFLNMKKGENGVGVTWKETNGFTDNLAWGTAAATNYTPIPEESLGQPTAIFSGNVNSYKLPFATIYSDGSVSLSFLTNVFRVVLGYTNQPLQVGGLGNPFSKEQLFVSNWIKNTQRVKVVLTKQGRNTYQNFVDTSTPFIRVMPSASQPYPSTTPPFPVQTKGSFRASGIEPYAKLIYNGTNTNQNNNAAWIVNQKTQYQRKFNPLKNLGV